MDRALGLSTARYSIQSICGAQTSREGVLCCDGVDRAIHLGDDLEGVSREAVRREIYCLCATGGIRFGCPARGNRSDVFFGYRSHSKTGRASAYALHDLHRTFFVASWLGQNTGILVRYETGDVSDN